ncbi:hypothetical protein C8F04DRAFT_1267157 [Mycena alexandri]|uniref:Uncharacterized protein n=1 Tax=Mycena alexandri TaxID=1745969 RepID=A0AAD6SHH1_9AGAR|nr:hypothetical protein C8F04DRAFT_1267157 [Mycena alexandri]
MAGPSRAAEQRRPPSSRSEYRSPSPDRYVKHSRAGPNLPGPSYVQKQVSPYAAERQRQKEFKAALKRARCANSENGPNKL